MKAAVIYKNGPPEVLRHEETLVAEGGCDQKITGTFSGHEVDTLGRRRGSGRSRVLLLCSGSRCWTHRTSDRRIHR